jgi:hypothetical protein
VTGALCAAALADQLSACRVGVYYIVYSMKQHHVKNRHSYMHTQTHIAAFCSTAVFVTGTPY